MTASHQYSLPRQFIVLARGEFENEFEPRRSYSLLSIRRPGSRFARGLCEEKQSSRCDVMMHAWDIDAPPWPRPLTELQARQAVKIVAWLHSAVFTASKDVHDIVVQSEGGSSQLLAIREFIAACTGMTATPATVTCQTHEATRELLEMAWDAHTIDDNTSPALSQIDQEPFSRNFLWKILLIMAVSANIDVILDSHFQVQQVTDLDTAANTIAALCRGADAPGEGDTVKASDEHAFLSGVFRLRKTWLLGVEDQLLLNEIGLNRHSSVVILRDAIHQIDLSSRALLQPWATHLICEASLDLSLPMKNWLKSGGHVLRTSVGDQSIITVSRHRLVVSELIHWQIRSAVRWS